MAGELNMPSRPRREANQRWDTLDSEQMSLAYNSFLDALSKIVLAPPVAVDGAVPVGMIFTGGVLTPNPTSGSDSKVRLHTDLFTAVDADGRFMVKSAGTTIDLTLPNATNQVYAYLSSDAAEPGNRRFVGVSSPYTEATRNVDTAYKGVVSLYARNGNATNVVASDVVNGKTVALVFLGIATVAAGVVTVSTALTSSRLSTVDAPSSVPSTNITNGSMRTHLELIKSALYLHGKALWNGSVNLTPAAANNYGAYEEVEGLGLDMAGRYALEWITVGDGTTTWGRLDRADYANDSLLLQAACDLIPVDKIGTIFLKDTNLNTLSGTVLVSDAKTIIIQGRGIMDDLESNAQISLGTTQSLLTCGIEGVRLILKDLEIRHTGTGTIADVTSSLEVYNCDIDRRNPSASNLPLFTIAGYLGACDVTKLVLRDSIFKSSDTGNRTDGWLIDYNTGATLLNNVHISNCQMIGSGQARTCLYLGVLGKNIVIKDCVFTNNSDTAGESTVAFIKLEANDTDSNACVSNCVFVGANSTTSRIRGINMREMANVVVRDCVFSFCTVGVVVGGTTVYKNQRIIDCVFDFSGATSTTGGFAVAVENTNSAVEQFEFRGNSCIFAGIEMNLGVATSANSLKNAVFSGNYFKDCGLSTVGGLLFIMHTLRNVIWESNTLIVETKTSNAGQGVGFFASSENTALTIRNSSFKGCYHKTSSSVTFALSVYGATLTDLLLDGNIFEEIQNVATNLGAVVAADCPRVVEVAYSACQNVLITKNQGKDLASAVGFVGVAPNNGTWLLIDSTDHAAVQTAQGSKGLVISENNIGDANSVMSLVFMPNRVRCRDILISKNNAEMLATSTAVTYVHDLIAWGRSGVAIAASVICQRLTIEGNFLRYVSGAGANAQKFIIAYGTSTTTTQIIQAQIINNIFMTSGAGGMSGTSIDLNTFAVTALRFSGNFYSIDSDAAAVVTMKVLFGSINVVELPSQPGVGVAWTENFKMVG